ncbi:MAG TPA: peptide MFS transporter [Steroidobacteraceae bacterium]|nr:peptide MFS transporter [Steroidobacteraceae bacterium]
MSNETASAAPAARGFFGQPAGISTLFFTELWERFSYYGMRAILLLFLVAQVQTGGMGLDDKTAAAIYGLYTAGVYIMSIPGGWLADRVLGAQRAILCGGTLIMIGHIILAFAPALPEFLIGLTVIVLGTGLLKPNVSAMVGAVQHGSETRRDAAFTLFYMAINIGATFGPIVVAWLAQTYGWHVGFGAAAVGMAFGLERFLRTRHRLGDVGLLPPGARPETARRNNTIMWTMVGVVVVLVAVVWSGVISVSPVVLQGRAIQVMALGVLAYFLWLLLFAKLTSPEKKGVFVLMVLVAASTLFWAGYEQAGSSLTLFAERFTDRFIGSYEFPAGWFQSVQAVFVLTCAPLLALVWTRLDARNVRVSVIAKFAVGVAGMGLGFLIMVGGAKALGSGHGASPVWLVMAYLSHVIGELFLSPVGMSATTRLVPRRFAGQGMGLWFTSLAMGNLFASRLAGDLGQDANGAAWSAYFLRMFGVAAAAAALLLILWPLLRRWAALDNARDGAGA